MDSMDLKPGDKVKLKSPLRGVQVYGTGVDALNLEGQVCEVVEAVRGGRVELRIFHWPYRGVPKDRPSVVWNVHPEAIDYVIDEPVPVKAAPECTCEHILAGCTCGAMEREQAAKGLVKDQWSGLWVAK